MSTHKSGMTVHAGRALLEETKRFSNEDLRVSNLFFRLSFFYLFS